MSIVVTIKQKTNGSIHDVASQHHDRQIVFKAGTKYAVVLAAYYGDGDIYTTHRTAASAVKQSNKQKKFSHSIVDTTGNWYHCDGYDLIRNDY